VSPAAISPELAAWRDRLGDAGLLLPSGTEGLWVRGATFEQIVDAVAAAAGRLGADQHPSTVRFPPVMSRPDFEATGYLRSFPTLIGSLHSFAGDDRDHARLLARLEGGLGWADELSPTDVVACSAACHPLYPTIKSPLPPGGQRWDVYGTVFRNEPSPEPARMQSFRQYEHVFVGEASGALAHRDGWLTRAHDLLDSLGLEPRAEVAHDPFFGRAGRLLAASQAESQLKYELLTAAGPNGATTAVASSNYHESHFGEAFGLACDDGSVAHSACVGFGVERITLALLWHHGLHPDQWPATIHRLLWP